MRPLLRKIFAFDQIPWVFLVVTLAAAVIQCAGAWRPLLIYDRDAIVQGEWWRIWTGHLVHFGWPHLVADAGLFLILGRLLERPHPVISRAALVAMPVVIAATLCWLDPAMIRYGGLSAIDFGLLLFLAGRGWQKDWVDWFWPAVLAIYVGEVILEATYGQGHGGGMIQFDDPSIRVGTAAHVGGGACGVLAWLCSWWHDRRHSSPDESCAPHA
jgi:rhomboid family GlyGly-CTERM serine protease